MREALYLDRIRASLQLLEYPVSREAVPLRIGNALAEIHLCLGIRKRDLTIKLKSRLSSLTTSKQEKDRRRTEKDPHHRTWLAKKLISMNMVRTVCETLLDVCNSSRNR